MYAVTQGKIRGSKIDDITHAQQSPVAKNLSWFCIRTNKLFGETVEDIDTFRALEYLAPAILSTKNKMLF